MDAAQRSSSSEVADAKPSAAELLDDEGLEFTDAYLSLEALMVNHDADGDAPLKKGEEPFRWSHIQSESRRLLDEATDLRVGIWHLRACMAQTGLQGMSEGLGLLSAALQEPATRIFPRAEAGENPRDAHAIALDWLGGPAFLAHIRQLPLSSRGPLTLGQVETSRPGTEHPTAPVRDEALPHVLAARQHLQAIRQTVYDDGAHWQRDPVHALECLDNIARALATDGMPAEAVTASAPATDSPMAPDGPASRSQVKRMLEHIQAYYERTEPSHPAPILISRLLRMVDASFSEILSELYAEHEQLTARLEKPSAS